MIKNFFFAEIEHDDPIQYYYERLVAVQYRGIKASHQVYRDILKGVQTTMVPRTLLKQWATQTFPSATDYWHFRKMVCCIFYYYLIFYPTLMIIVYPSIGIGMFCRVRPPSDTFKSGNDVFTSGFRSNDN